MLQTLKVEHSSPEAFYEAMVDNAWTAIQVIAKSEGWGDEETIALGWSVEQAIRQGIAERNLQPA